MNAHCFISFVSAAGASCELNAFTFTFKSAVMSLCSCEFIFNLCKFIATCISFFLGCQLSVCTNHLCCMLYNGPFAVRCSCTLGYFVGYILHPAGTYIKLVVALYWTWSIRLDYLLYFTNRHMLVLSVSGWFVDV